jgi:hypothetical protein
MQILHTAMILMISSNPFFVLVAGMLVLLTTAGRLPAAVYNVGNLADLTNDINLAQPGDQIILANGVYTNTNNINISCAGTATQPVLIAAQTVGGAQIAGTAGFYFSGASYVTLQGFFFTYSNNNQNGLQIDTSSSHCRITRNIFQTDPVQYWCFVQGDDTEVDHNLFQNKAAQGEYITLDGNHTTLRIARRLWAHDNDFFNNHFSGSNGGESTRLGIGIFKLISAWAVVENNLYEHADGDPESLSVKTSDNVVRYNTFTNCVGEISLRQGCRSRVEGNFSFNTGGLKFYADDHLIINNYFQGVTNGVQFGAGDWPEITDSDNNASGPHAAAHRARVEFNTMVNCPIFFDWNNQGTNVPTDCIVANNILQGNSGYFVSQNLLIGETNFIWQTNIFWGSASTAYSPAGGYTKVNPLLTNNAVIPYHIASNSPAIGASYAAPGEVVSDMDGQSRFGTPAIGADEYSTAPVIHRPLGTNNVGPYVAATNFAIVAMPWIQTVMPGTGTCFTNLISAFNGFTNLVILSAANLPPNSTASFNFTTITNGLGFSVMSVTTSNATPPGRYTILITATSATFTNTTIACLTVGNIPTNWTDTDIGQPAVSGSVDYYSNVFAVKGSGSQIFGTTDQFNFTYQPWTNGLQLTARVLTQPATSLSAKSGVMIRETTNASSKYVDVVVTPSSINMEARTTTGGSAVQLAMFTAANSTVGTNSPSWVRLRLQGSTFTGFASSDGVNWVQTSVTNINMSSTLAGLAVCAYDNTQLNTSTFDNVNYLATNNQPIITFQPTNETVILNNNATFGVTANGASPFNYQWWFNTNTMLVGASNASLVITNVQGTNAGNYMVVVTNLYGLVTSSVAILTVKYPPVITNQPVSQSTLGGSNVTFTVGTSGDATLSYQWWFNTNSIVYGATNSTLSITNAQVTNAGIYSVVVTNPYGSVTSAVATLTVTIPFVVTSYTNPGAWTWTCPSNVIFVRVECWGGGGAGGGASRNGQSGGNATGGGGAGGSYARMNSYPVIAGNSYYLNVGAGGTNQMIDAAMFPGGDSWFNTNNSPSITIIAKGGGGGETVLLQNTTTRHGAGGTNQSGSLGDIVFAGGVGGTPTGTSFGGSGGGSGGTNSLGNAGDPASGIGANAVLGGGNGGNANPTSGSSGSGQAPTNSPGGGGGGARNAGTSTNTGGTGSVGQIVLKYFTASTVTSSAATGIGLTNATFNGNAWDNGNAISDRGFYYKTNGGVTTNDTKITAGSGAGGFTATPALSPSTQYYWKAYASNVGGTVLSSELSFSTLALQSPVITNVSMSSSRVAFNLTGVGVANQAYALFTVSNLTPPVIWISVATNIGDTNGIFNFTDWQVTNFAQRFYRVGTP